MIDGLDLVLFLDTETTGLAPRRGPGAGRYTWEIGATWWDPQTGAWETLGAARRLPRLEERRAEPGALEVGGYALRDPATLGPSLPFLDVASEINALCAGRQIAAVNPAFDAANLAEVLAEIGEAPRWHYRLLSVADFAAGCAGLRPPYSTTIVADAVGVSRDPGHHTALADARWARDVWLAAALGQGR